MNQGLGRSSAAGVLVLLALPVVFWLSAAWIPSLQIAWLVDIGALSLFLGLVGTLLVGHPLGVLIDERNRYSLARLQTVIWTIVVLSAFGLMAFRNVVVGTSKEALAVAVPEQLWLALGITVVSLAGTPIIRSVKANSDRGPRPDVARDTIERLVDGQAGLSDAAFTPISAPRLTGLIVRNVEPAEASWPDLFQGEEAGNGALTDIGKVQMFFFTALIVAVYGVAIWVSLGKAVTTELPAVSDSMNALLGIANGAYLANAAAPHTPTV
jgi:hypothetical protein